MIDEATCPWCGTDLYPEETQTELVEYWVCGYDLCPYWWENGVRFGTAI